MITSFNLARISCCNQAVGNQSKVYSALLPTASTALYPTISPPSNYTLYPTVEPLYPTINSPSNCVSNEDYNAQTMPQLGHCCPILAGHYSMRQFDDVLWCTFLFPHQARLHCHMKSRMLRQNITPRAIFPSPYSHSNCTAHSILIPNP